MQSIATTLRALASTLLVGSCAIAFWAVPACAAMVTFSQSSAVTDCDTITVDVIVDQDVNDLRGFSFVFEFDPAIVMPISMEPGAIVEGAGCPNFFTWPNESAIGDSIWVDGVALGCSVDGPGSFIRMRFVGVTDGVSQIECRTGILRDSDNQAIPFTCVQGEIESNCANAIEPMRWGRIKALYR